jgi:hypothetical protein
VVVVVVGKSPGIGWEIEQALRNVEPERLLIFLRYVDEGELNVGLELIKCQFISCHWQIVFHLPLLVSRASGTSQRQMRRIRLRRTALFAPLR